MEGDESVWGRNGISLLAADYTVQIQLGRSPWVSNGEDVHRQTGPVQTSEIRVSAPYPANVRRNGVLMLGQRCRK